MSPVVIWIMATAAKRRQMSVSPLRRRYPCCRFCIGDRKCLGIIDLSPLSPLSPVMRDRQKQLFLPVIFRQNHNVCSNLAQIRQSSLRLEPSHLRQLQPSGLGQHAGGTPLGKSLADLDAEGFRQNNELRAAAFTFSPKSHTVDAGGYLGVQILKTTCSVLFDEQAQG